MQSDQKPGTDSSTRVLPHCRIPHASAHQTIRLQIRPAYFDDGLGHCLWVDPLKISVVFSDNFQPGLKLS